MGGGACGAGAFGGNKDDDDDEVEERLVHSSYSAEDEQDALAALQACIDAWVKDEDQRDMMEFMF